MDGKKDEHTQVNGRTDERTKEKKKKNEMWDPLIADAIRARNDYHYHIPDRYCVIYRQFSREREINTQHAQQLLLLLFERARARTKWPIMMMMVALFFGGGGC